MTRTALTLGLSLAMAFLPCRAHAADDGGTRSIFAQGAGVRGLAMGGAFVALANDATTLLWNPGGLGLVPQCEVQAAHAEYGFGFREEYAGGILPSWRWGAVGFAYRSFATSDIERRDDRNVLIEDDLGSSESELTVGIGHAFGGAWSAGGAVKLQSQTIGDLSGSGVGIDAGVWVMPLLAAGSTVPWADRISVGIAARNLIEPSIRLSTESVSDPATFRIGAAYRHRWANAELDLEHARGVGPRLHVGAEAHPHPLLSVRCGWSGSGPVGGLGVRWQKVEVSYAYEEDALSPIHRMGISLALGPSISERRAASLRAEEERIQSRLAEAFDQAERERVDSLLARADEARAQERYETALDILGTVVTLAPAETRALALERRCLLDKAAGAERSSDFTSAALSYARLLGKDPADSTAVAGLARCRAESDRRAARSAEIRERFARAMDAFAAEDFASARSAFVSILAANPGDTEAMSMLRRTELAIARRTDALLVQARRSIQADRLVEASALLDQVRALDGKAKGLLETTLMLTQARQLSAPKPTESSPAPMAAQSRPARPALSAQRRRELADLYRRGLAAMEQKRPDDALRYWEIVWSSDPTYARVGDYLKREYLMRGLNAFANGRLEEALGLWERALLIDPEDARVKGYIARAEKQLARTRELLGDTGER